MFETMIADVLERHHLGVRVSKAGVTEWCCRACDYFVAAYDLPVAAVQAAHQAPLVLDALKGAIAL